MNETVVVQLETTMAQLQVGDIVRVRSVDDSGAWAWEPVLGFLHRAFPAASHRDGVTAATRRAAANGFGSEPESDSAQPTGRGTSIRGAASARSGTASSWDTASGATGTVTMANYLDVTTALGTTLRLTPDHNVYTANITDSELEASHRDGASPSAGGITFERAIPVQARLLTKGAWVWMMDDPLRAPTLSRVTSVQEVSRDGAWQRALAHLVLQVWSLWTEPTIIRYVRDSLRVGYSGWQSCVTCL